MSRSTAAGGGLVLVAVALVADASAGGDLVALPPVLLLVAVVAYAVGTWSTPGRSAVVVVLATLALALASRLGSPGEYPILDDLVFFTVLVGAPVVAGAALAGRSRQLTRLRELVGLLSAQRADAVRLAQAEERNRVEVGLHRGFGEDLSAIALRVEGARQESPAGMRQALADVETAARRSLDHLREELGTLRRPPGPGGDGAAADPGVATPRSAGSALVDPHGERGGRAAEASIDPPAIAGRDLALAMLCSASLVVETLVSPAAQGSAAAGAGLALVVGAALLPRRRHPVAAAAGSCAAFIAMALWLTPPQTLVSTIAPLLIVAYSVGAHTSGRSRLTGLLVLVGGWSAVLLAGPAESRDTEAILATSVWAALGLAAGVVTAGRTARAARLHRLVDELERGREVEVRLAIAEQRLCTAAELHDTVARALTVVCLQAAAGQLAHGTDEVDDALVTVARAARSGLAELRGGLDGLGEAQSLTAEELAAEARRSGLHPQVTLTGPVGELPPAVRVLASRVLRECLTNAGRYAPGSRVRIRVDVGDSVALEVRDCGGGGDRWSHGAGTGLATLRREVERLGGRLAWGATSDGFEVNAVLAVERVRA